MRHHASRGRTAFAALALLPLLLTTSGCDEPFAWLISAKDGAMSPTRTGHSGVPVELAEIDPDPPQDPLDVFVMEGDTLP